MTGSAQPQQTDRPAHEVRAAGIPLDAALQKDVVEIDITEEVYRHGRCTLLLQNWKPDERQVRWSDTGPLVPGADIEVLLGYGSKLTLVFAGVVTALTVHFTADQMPMLQVEARSRSILLSGPVHSRIFNDVSDGDVVDTLAAEVGLKPETETGAQRATVVADRVNAWDLLVRRGRALGWVVYVRENTLVARPPAPQRDPLQLTWTKNLVEFRMTQDVGQLPNQSTTTSWDPNTHEAVSTSTSSPSGNLQTGDRPDHQAVVSKTDWPGRQELDAGAAVRTVGELDAAARANAMGAELRHYTGIGQIVGTATLRCDSWVTLDGAGTRFSGPFYVSSVRHRFGRLGFTTEFGLGVAAPLQPTATTTQEQSARRGPVIGVVTDVIDPHGIGRVMVSFPWSGGTTSTWARLATPYAGKSQGFCFVPDVDQEVLVDFIDGSPDDAVVLASLWSGSAPPPRTTRTENNERALVTRSGHVLAFDDTEPGAVQLSSKGGHRIEMSDRNRELVIADSSGNSITLSENGIEMSTATGDLTLSAAGGAVTIDAMTFAARAKSSVRVESSVSASIVASADLGIRGAVVNIN